MKVLYICSGNFTGTFEIAQVFIHEQMEELRKMGVECDLFLVRGKGIFGYLANVFRLNSRLYGENYDLVHAVYGLSGLVAILQFKSKVITTFIGSDVNNTRKWIPKLVSRCSEHSIFVEKSMPAKLGKINGYSVIPFGLNTAVFTPMDKQEARKILSFGQNEKIILFCSSFTRPEKNYPLAAAAIKLLPYPVTLIEMGQPRPREELNTLFNACEMVLMTSLHEGSPQVIKEAMACSLPIVSTDVGDVREILGDTEGTYLCSYDPADVADKIRQALEFAEKRGRTNGRERILGMGLDNRSIAERVYQIYRTIAKIKE